MGKHRRPGFLGTIRAFLQETPQVGQEPQIVPKTVKAHRIGYFVVNPDIMGRLPMNRDGLLDWVEYSDN